MVAQDNLNLAKKAVERAMTLVTAASAAATNEAMAKLAADQAVAESRVKEAEDNLRRAYSEVTVAQARVSVAEAQDSLNKAYDRVNELQSRLVLNAESVKTLKLAQGLLTAAKADVRTANNVLQVTLERAQAAEDKAAKTAKATDATDDDQNLIF